MDEFCKSPFRGIRGLDPVSARTGPLNLCIVTASNNEQVLIDNLLTSPIADKYPVITRTGFDNVPKAYNTAQVNGAEIVMYVHNDVFIPADFEEYLEVTLQRLPENWAVLGVAGVQLSMGKRTIHGNINDRGREWGAPIHDTKFVDTLDELLLIVNTKHGLKFDERFPLDFYGADICMQAHEQQLPVFVIPGYVHHNSKRPFGNRTPGFYASETVFAVKWLHRLPIATTCAIVTDEKITVKK